MTANIAVATLRALRSAFKRIYPTFVREFFKSCFFVRLPGVGGWEGGKRSSHIPTPDVNG